MKPPIKEGQYLVYLFGNNTQPTVLSIAICNGERMEDVYCSSNYNLSKDWSYTSASITVLGIFDCPVDETYIINNYPDYLI